MLSSLSEIGISMRNSELDSNIKTTTGTYYQCGRRIGDPEVQGDSVQQTTPTVIETTYPNRKSAETLKDSCCQQTNGCGCVVLFSSFVVFAIEWQRINHPDKTIDEPSGQWTNSGTNSG